VQFGVNLVQEVEIRRVYLFSASAFEEFADQNIEKQTVLQEMHRLYCDKNTIFTDWADSMQLLSIAKRVAVSLTWRDKG
jgi:hypothetical protein